MTEPLRLVRNDAVVPVLTAPDRAWEVWDAAGHLRGVVAGSGRSWTAGRIGPTRARPFVGMVNAATRAAAVERLVRGRP